MNSGNGRTEKQMSVGLIRSLSVHVPVQGAELPGRVVGSIRGAGYSNCITTPNLY